MAFGVFQHRSDSIYDDSPAEQYQFPPMYLDRVTACVGDWIVYLEPGKVRGTRGYFAIARVQEVVRDPKAPEMYLALIEPGSYLDFGTPVSFKNEGGLLERGLLNENGRIARGQWAVRPISAADFNRIIELGLGSSESPLPRVEHELSSSLEEAPVQFLFEQARERLMLLTSRIVRERVFRKVVLRAYDERCAITGLKLINGRGRAEVVAAHIRPVESNGPDIINNGLALSGTAHWMFDRGLISLGDDLQILVSRHVNDQESVRGFVNSNGRALAPGRQGDRPHPRFLQWHREACFKQ